MRWNGMERRFKMGIRLNVMVDGRGVVCAIRSEGRYGTEAYRPLGATKEYFGGHFAVTFVHHIAT